MSFSLQDSPAIIAEAPVRRRRKLQAWQIAPYLFISPFFILFLVFGLFPLLFSIYLAFMRWDPSDRPRGDELRRL